MSNAANGFVHRQSIDASSPTSDEASLGVGLAPIADNFDTSTGVYTNGRGVPGESADRNGSFRLICQPGQLAYDDPW